MQLLECHIHVVKVSHLKYLFGAPSVMLSIVRQLYFTDKFYTRVGYILKIQLGRSSNSKNAQKIRYLAGWFNRREVKKGVRSSKVNNSKNVFRK